MTNPERHSGTAGYRDRDGNAINVEEWGRLWEDLDYRIVGDTHLGRTHIRTIWHGLDCEPMSLFLTGMVHHEGKWTTVANADTLAGAIAAHERTIHLEEQRRYGEGR